MRLLLILFAAFVGQEYISSNAAMLAVYQAHYSVWLIHALFLAATALDILVGYAAGKWIQRRFADAKITQAAKRVAGKLDSFMGKRSKWLSLIILGFINYIYVSAFLIAWLDVSFFEMALFLSIGDLLWYASEWVLIAGVSIVFPNPYLAFAAVLGISLAVVIAVRFIWRAPRRF